MFAQGSQLVNPAYFAALEAQARAIRTCDDLRVFTEDAVAPLNAVIDGINGQLALIKPILDLLTSPGADPQQIVTWLTTFITSFLTPYVRPYTVYVAQAAEIAASVAALITIIEDRSGQLPSCSITAPPLTPVQI